MQELKEKLKNYKLKTTKKKFKHEWTASADEMTTYFKRNCYWLFWKYPKQKIYEAYQACQVENKKNIEYLIGILRK